MLVKRLRTVGLVIVVLAFLGIAAEATAAPAAASLAGPCAPGVSYDPACDVDHDGDVDIFDIQLSAGHWNQTGTWMSDNAHNHLGQTWVGTSNPLKIEGSFSTSSARAPLILGNSYPIGVGLRIESAGDGVGLYSIGNDGVYVSSAGNDGVHVVEAIDDGLAVDTAFVNGVHVDHAGYHGVQVNSTGLNGVNVDSAGAHGFRVNSAGGSGVVVGSAGTAGIYVGSAGSEGFQLGYGGDTGVDGIEINAAADDGVDINQAGDNGIGVSNAVNWEIYVVGDVRITGTCSGCESAIFAQNVGDTILQPGDVVAAQGILKPELAHTPAIVAVMPAPGSEAVIGVVSSRAELTFDGDEPEGEGVPDLVPREGAAQPGDYLSIIVDGMVQVRVDARQGAIRAGQRLTGGERAGTARSLRTVEVDGVELAESAPVLGIALEDLKQGEGLIWVLVNPQ